MDKRINFSQLFASSGVLMLLAFGLSLLTGLPHSVGHVSFNVVLVGAILGAILFVVMAVVGFFLQRYVYSYSGLMRELRQLFKSLNWPTIIVISIMAGVSEELLFRGVLQSYLIEKSSVLLGIFVSSALFGLMHFYNKLYILLTFLVGLFLGWLYYFTGSLLFVVVLHAVYDVLAFGALVKFPDILGLEE